MTKRVCIVCGTEFEVTHEKQRYCSRQCRRKAQNARYRGTANENNLVGTCISDGNDTQIEQSHTHIPDENDTQIDQKRTNFSYENDTYIGEDGTHTPESDELEYVSGGCDSTLMASDYCDLPEHPTPEVDLSDTLKDIGNPPSNDQSKQLPASPLTTERLRRDIEKELLRLNYMVCDNTTNIAELRESLTVSDEDEFYDYFEDLKQNRAEQIFTNVEDIINANLTDIKKYILCQIVTRPFVIRLLSGTNIDHLESLFSQAYKLDDIVTRLNQLDESKKAIIKTINNLYKRQRLLMNGSEDETTDVEQLNNDEL